MKIFYLLFNSVMLLLPLFVSGQKNNIQSAKNYMRSYEKEKKNTGDLENAKRYIDLAAANKTTADDYDMWCTQGEIYLFIYRDTVLTKKYPEVVKTAASSLVSCMQNDSRGFRSKECVSALVGSGVGLLNTGVSAYQNERYEEAIDYYMRLLPLFPYDTANHLKRANISEYHVYKNSYYAAVQLEDDKRAKAYLEQLIGLNAMDPFVYKDQSEYYLKDGDTAGALKYIEKGRKLFEDNTMLINAELQIYISSKKTDELIKKVTIAIGDDPEYESLYYYRGALYDQLGKQNEAEVDYLKTLELNPAYFNALYNLGALYFNQAVTEYNLESSSQEKVNALFKKSVPHLEKALEIQPNDQSTLVSLQKVYAYTGETEKYQAIKKRILGSKNP